MAWPLPWEYPRDTADKLYLARAFEQVAESRLPNVRNPLVVEFKPEFIPSKLSLATPSHIAKARELLQKQATQAGAGRKHLCDNLTEDDLKTARQLEREEWSKWGIDWGNWNTLKELFQAALSEGQVKSFLRPIAGGAFIGPLDASVWNVDDCSGRFETCQMRAMPFQDPSPENNLHWIYVDKGDLEHALLAQPSKLTEADKTLQISPYLCVMLEVCRKLAITPDNQPNKDAVVYEIRNLWEERYQHLKPISNHLLEAMGTLVREPDSQLGRGKK
jgi:hypothetical protein